MACADKKTMLDRVKSLTLRRLSDRLMAATVQHVNRDGYFSPSEWWYDSGWTVRHTLATSAVWRVDGSVATLSLTYTVKTK